MSDQGQVLKTEIDYLKGVGPAKGELIRQELGIFTFEDFLMYFPFRYIDRSKVYKIREVNGQDAFVQVKGTISKVQEQTGKNPRQKRLTAQLKDDTGTLELVWFKGAQWIKKYVIEGREYLVFGRPNVFKGRINIPHPEMEIYTEAQRKKGLMGIRPVYASTEKLKNKGLDSNGIMKIQQGLLEQHANAVRENLPLSITGAFRLMERQEAIKQIHFPEDFEKLEKAKNRLKFEELFFTQLKMVRYKSTTQKLQGHVYDQLGFYFHRFYQEILPFELTGAQKRVLREIRHDLKSGYQMNRLMQGDVGSGKTIVALMAMLMALDNGHQGAVMAPTEVLATQHFNTIFGLVQSMDINVRLLTGSTKAAERREILEQVANGAVQILIGTHALIEDKVQFHQLGFAVIDEQHRFGVAQRARLWKKSKIPPHVLVMTATPIPRTLAMTLYGDLENSVIDELPPGRKPVETRHVYENKRNQVFGFLKQMIDKGQQVYIVYPLIEESETLDYKNLMEGYEAVCREFPRPDYQVGIVHGQMKPEDKEYEMNRFKEGHTQILVSTTVIEVGVDVPNATVMVIESAERFGLSQLHQLRGRVGRGAEKSYCILMTGYELSREARVRMETMCKTNDGFELSEADMNLRGPGDMMGTRQSGDLNFKIANLATDQKILDAARKAAQQLIQEDPDLQKPENQQLQYLLEEGEQSGLKWSLIS